MSGEKFVGEWNIDQEGDVGSIDVVKKLLGLTLLLEDVQLNVHQQL
jgi:hypothetical protein